jgi:gamma-glutamyltranspeptidase/glutathione hydrolase/leukotriene-C4 hydrolase
MDRNTGIILNDEMDDFSTPGKVNAFGLKPSPYNYPEPGKRPLSSTAATIVERPDGSLYAALGGSGGSRIFGAVTQVLLNIEWGMDVTNAVEAPRLHDQLFPTTVTIETGKLSLYFVQSISLTVLVSTAFGDEMVESLKSRGHNVTMFDINLVSDGTTAPYP